MPQRTCLLRLLGNVVGEFRVAVAQRHCRSRRNPGLAGAEQLLQLQLQPLRPLTHAGTFIEYQMFGCANCDLLQCVVGSEYPLQHAC